jgi:heptosyltransferase I
MTSASPPPVDLRDFKSVLVVKPSSLGDIVHTLPAARLIKRAHPHLKLRWIANSEWTPLIDGCPFVDEVIAFPRNEFRGVAGGLRSLAWAAQWNRTARETPEIVLDFQGLLRSGSISFTRGSDWIVGMSDAREGAAGFFDQVVPVDPQAHAVDRYLEIVRALGIEFGAKDVAFDLPEGAPPSGFDATQSFVLLHPYSRGEGKALEPAVLQMLCDGLNRARIVVVGVAEPAPVERGGHVIDLTNRTTLPELIWLMRHARACVSVDSGPMHIAAAVNERTLGIHTWTDPRKVGPYTASAWVWKASRIAHRTEFTDAECVTDAQVSELEARRIADFVVGTMMA